MCQKRRNGTAKRLMAQRKWHNRRPHRPWAFTEHGALQAANILRSQRAVETRPYVIRAFVKMREELTANPTIRPNSTYLDGSKPAVPNFPSGSKKRTSLATLFWSIIFSPRNAASESRRNGRAGCGHSCAERRIRVFCRLPKQMVLPVLRRQRNGCFLNPHAKPGDLAPCGGILDSGYSFDRAGL